MDPSLYATFFVLAGAELLPSSVLGLGVVGAGYAAARTVGQNRRRPDWIARAGRSADGAAPPRVLSGVVLLTGGRADDSNPIGISRIRGHLTGIVLAAVVIFEIVGPLLIRRALLKTGEAKTMPEPLQRAANADLTV